MSGDWHNPLDTIVNAATSMIGWAMVIPCLVYLGLVLGCLPKHPNECISAALGYFVILPFSWIFSPLIIPAYLVTAVAYWWPLRSEAIGAYVAAGSITVLAWAIASSFSPF